MYYTALRKIVSVDESVKQLMQARCYSDERMYAVLKEIGVLYISDFDAIAEQLDYTKFSTHEHWGFVSERGNALLNNRYIFPIRDFGGNLTALAGWNKRTPKYVVTPTYGFTRDTQFFNAEDSLRHVQAGDKTVYLVEGFFDALSLRSLGFNALGNFGLYLNAVKSGMLERFEKVVVIGDADTAGKKAYPYLDGSVKQRSKQWHIDIPCTFVKLKMPYVKDADDLVRFYDCSEELYDLRNKGAVFTLTEEP